ncbi:HNH endonuclease [Peptostreptococcaceae bacterium AGR-M142]
MYEKDTFARLYFPSNKEVEAEVKNSVRKNGSTCPLTKKPENRYLTTKDKNQMSLKPSSVEFKSNEGLKLSTLVEDSFGAKLISHKNINLNSKGSISFHAKNMVNIKAKTDVLFYRDNKLNPQSFTTENEFHYLGNNVLLEGADRSSYSALDDDPLLVTPIREGFFDGILDGLGKFALGVAAGLAGVACVAVVVGTGGLALAAAGVVAMSTVGSAVMGAFVVGGISVVVSEGINRGRGVELNQEESFKMGISAAVSGAVMGAFGFADALKINIGAAVIGESATQIMDREFRPMDFGLTIGMEVIFYGIGKGVVKVKAMKAEGRSLIPKNIDVKQALKSATNKAKKEIADSLAKINSFKKAISKGIAKIQKKIADGLQNGVDELSKFLPKINSPQFEFALVGGSNNYKFECEIPKSTNPLYEGSITQFAAESTKKVVKSGKNFIDVKTTTKNAAEESTGKTNSTIIKEAQEEILNPHLGKYKSVEEYLAKVEEYIFEENPTRENLGSIFRKGRTQEEAKKSYQKVLKELKNVDPNDYNKKIKELYDIEKQRILENTEESIKRKYKPNQNIEEKCLELKQGDGTSPAFKQDEFASSYEERIAQTPASANKKVSFEGVRGESLCILKPPPDPEIKKILSDAGIDGIEYKNGIPNFSPVAKVEFEIEYMLGGIAKNGDKARRFNFSQADRKLLNILNNSPELAKEFGFEFGEINLSKIKKYRVDNKLTWHELNDAKTIQLVLTKINSTFGHLGGVGEINSGIFK